MKKIVLLFAFMAYAITASAQAYPESDDADEISSPIYLFTCLSKGHMPNSDYHIYIRYNKVKEKLVLVWRPNTQPDYSPYGRQNNYWCCVREWFPPKIDHFTNNIGTTDVIYNHFNTRCLQISIPSRPVNIEEEGENYEVDILVSAPKKIQTGHNIYNEPIYDNLFNIEGIIITDPAGNEVFARKSTKLKAYSAKAKERQRIEEQKLKAEQARREAEQAKLEEERRCNEELERQRRAQKLAEYKQQYWSKIYSVKERNNNGYQQFVDKLEAQILQNIASNYESSINTDVYAIIEVDTLGRVTTRLSDKKYAANCSFDDYPVLKQTLSEIQKTIPLPSCDTIALHLSKKSTPIILQYKKGGTKILKGDSDYTIPVSELNCGFGRYDIHSTCSRVNDKKKEINTVQRYNGKTITPERITEWNKVRHRYIGYDYSLHAPFGLSIGYHHIAASPFGVFAHYKTAFGKLKTLSMGGNTKDYDDYKGIPPYKGIRATMFTAGATWSCNRWCAFNIGAGYGKYGHKYGSYYTGISSGVAFEAGAMFRIYKSLALTAGYNAIYTPNAPTKLMNDFNVGFAIFIK